MKRILIIDESEAVRETLALILGRDFVVVKRPLGTRGVPFAEAGDDVDLVIVGITPTVSAEASSLLQFALQAPFAVLFLVESKFAARTIENQEQVDCLAKPFNPYELVEKVGRLLSRQPVFPKALAPSTQIKTQGRSLYLDFPYLSKAAAAWIQRFVITRLPIMISGEIGCGQDRVARAIHNQQENPGSRVWLNGSDINAGYLAQKSLELSWSPYPSGAAATLCIENIDGVLPASQPLLLNFMEQVEQQFSRWRVLTTARGDLLEKVYRGEFLESLFYRLAILTLKLSPLRERRADIPLIADWFARSYAETLGLGEVTFSAGARERLSNYLWFGNLNEMETVIARTLALHRKTYLDAGDLVFDFPGDGQTLAASVIEDLVPVEPQGRKESYQVTAQPRTQNFSAAPPDSENGQAKSVELNVLIHELAHELKNPMVTIKTFAQLLRDRYQDENFRARFQDVVGGDIERMDDLLEVMIEFADFSQPRSRKVPLEEKLRTALNEISSECAKRQARFRWKGNGINREVRTDEDQLKYVLKNVLLVVLSQARMGSEIEIDVERQGCVAISYLREGPPMGRITHYFRASAPGADENLLPLRILLAKQLVERNGGRMAMDQSDSERDFLRMEFPIA